MAYKDSVVHGIPLTEENFTHPPLEMGIVPFWFWNGALEPEELEWQLREYYDRGVRSLFIHGRMGLQVPYLSEGWFDRVRFVVEKGREIGIDTWVYDEMDWPSGTAQKQVLKQYPELAQRYLELVPLSIEGPLFTFLEAHDSRYVPTGNSNPIAAFGVPTRAFKTDITETIDLTKNLSFEKTIPWEAPAGKWTLMYFLEKEAPWYIDTLNPESTERFIELTHDQYKKAVGHAFGSTVPGFFTDEPAMYYFEVGMRNYVVPWSRQMFKIFRDRRGYDLKPFLPALYTGMGAQTAQIRFDFWRTVAEQYEETYYKRLRDWCDENGVIFTGHVLFEELLRLQARCEGNIFKQLRHMHLIGVDHLYPKIGTPKEPEQHVALKLASSAAHHYGSTRLLCESMGGTYWDCTLERMKWMANWEYVLGVNLFNNHGYHYSIEGERKRDWPPSQFYHHTWWKYYDRFTTYMARLSHLLSGGRHVAKVLVLYPLTSIWANFVPQERDRLSRVIEEDFYYLTDTLLRLHYDFDYVDEEVLAGATIEDGQIRIGEEAYDVLLIPPSTHIQPATYAAAHRFVDSGGSLVATTLVPSAFVTTEEDAHLVGGDGAAPDFEAFFGADPGALEAAAVGRLGAEMQLYHQNGRGAAGRGQVFVLGGPNLKRSKPAAQLREILQRCTTPDVTISAEEVFYLHRVKDGYDLYFLTNTTQKPIENVEITFERVARPERWDPNTGEIEPIHVYDVRDGRLVLHLDFPASEAHVVVLRDDVAAAHVVETNLHDVRLEGDAVVGYRGAGPDAPAARLRTPEGERQLTAPAKEPLRPIRLPAAYAFEMEQDNALLVGRWKMTMADGDAGFAAPDYDDSGWLNVTNGAWEMQLPQERDDATYPVTLWYRTSFDVRALPGNPRLLIDGFRGTDFRLFLNGREVEDRGTRSWLDAEITEVNVRPFLQEGRNVVAVRLTVHKRTEGVLDLLKIVGDFSLEGSAEAGYAIAPTRTELRVGDWTRQGLPFFSGTGVYRTEVEVPAAYLGEGRVFLDADCGEDVLEVRINGSAPRVAPWHPYRLEVTDLLQPGTNTVELRVTNTLINILEGVEHRSGLFRRPRLVHEHRYTLRP